MMNNVYMKSYWQGYRAAKRTDENCGIDTVRNAHAYGLQGKSDAYCRGYARYIRDRGRRGAHE